MDVKPLHAILIVTVALALVGIAAYSGIQARLVLGPSDLRLDRAGHLHVRIDREIFVYDDNQQLADNYSLDRFGVNGLLGSFDFFSDNSLMLVADSVADNTAVKPGQLLRCTLASNDCTLLGANNLTFQSSFRAHADRNDQIFLAHTANDVVFWLDEDGRELARLEGAFNRPNHLWRYDNHLAIANTDDKELVIVPLQGDTFAAEEKWQRIALDSKANKSRREQRPIDFLYLDSSWYILTKTADMLSGAIYRYDDEGSYQSHITLPAGTDPMAMAYLGDSLVVADYAGMRVYRFTPDGEQVADLDSPEQRQHIERLQQHRLKYTVIEYASWGVFAIALLVGFFVAIGGELRKAEMKSKEAPEKSDSTPAQPTSRPHPMESAIHWLQPKKTSLRVGLAALVMILAMPLLTGLGVPQAEEPKEICMQYTLSVTMWILTASMLAIFVPLILKMRTTVSTRLGFRDEWVLVDHGSGSMYIARDTDLISVANGFIIDGVTIPTGNHKITLYNTNELDTWLKPRLARGSSLGAVAQTAWQWHNHRGLFLLTAAAIIAGGAIILSIEMGWLEERFEEWLQTQPECSILAEEQRVEGGPEQI